MSKLEEITRAFNNEKEVLIVCSPKLVSAIDDDIASISSSRHRLGLFKLKDKIDIGVKSVHYNGVSIHYCSDFEQLVHNIFKTAKNKWRS